MSRISEILLQAKLVHPLHLQDVEQRLQSTGGRIARLVAEMGICTEEQIATAVSRTLRIERAPEGILDADVAALQTLGEAFAKVNGCLPLRSFDGDIRVAFADPTEPALVDRVARTLGASITRVAATETQILKTLTRIRMGQLPAAAAPPPSTANELLAEVMGDADELGLSPDQRAHLETLHANQRKSRRILEALTELLEEKGYVSRGQLPKL